MPKIIKGTSFFLIVLITSFFLISCSEKIGNEIILVDSVEISGLYYITKQDLLRGASVLHEGRIAVDIGRLRLTISKNMLIKKSKITFNQNTLFVDITEKEVLAGIGVLVDNRIIPGILLHDMTALSGYYKLDIPMIIGTENFFRKAGDETNLDDIARLLRRTKIHLPQVYRQISTIRPLGGNKIEVTLIGRNAKFEFDVSEDNIDRLRLFAGYIDVKRYSPSRVNIYGDRAIIR